MPEGDPKGQASIDPAGREERDAAGDAAATTEGGGATLPISDEDGATEDTWFDV